MEVFLRNLPVELTDQSLASQLKPFTEALQIDDATYHCEKAKKKNIGFILFLHKADGYRFLASHQEVVVGQPQPQGNGYGNLPGHRYPPAKARLRIMNRDVFCKLSNKEPTEHALSAIRYQVEQRRIQREKLEEQKRQKEKGGKPQPDKADDKALILNASCTSCGHWIFDRQHEGRFTFVADWTDTGHCTAKFTKRNLLIQTATAEIRVPFPTIEELVWSENGHVALTLNSAPILLTPKPNTDTLALLGALSLSGGGRGSQGPQRSRLPAIDGNHARVSSFCTVYYFRVQRTVSLGHRATHSPDPYQQFRRLKEKDLFQVTKFDFGVKGYDVPVGQGITQLKELLGHSRLPFSFIFMLQRLVYDGYFPANIVCDLTQRLTALFKSSNTAQQYPISEEAFRKLFRMDFPSPSSDPRAFEVDGIMDFLKHSEEEIRNGFSVGSELFKETDSLVRIHRAIVTPTRIYLEEGMEAKNRILRKFTENHDYFMRVQFCDENGQDLHFNAKVSLEPIYNRFKMVLANGISIGTRVYRFLGFSHSSLRAHSVWLSAPFLHNNQLHIPESIITGLGKFEKIKSPARRAARIGQAFSETPYTVPLDQFGISVMKIKDVERNGRVFSDGVGTMSYGVLEAVHRVIPESKGYPTCVQIRWAGAKGMLALDPTLPGSQFCIRPSMEKFDSEDTLNLEICDLASKPIALVLNRQLVKILEDMGAPESWFLDLQEKELNRLRMITASAYNTANFLKTQSIGDCMGLSTLLRHTDRIGVDYRRDRFLFAVVNAVVLKELRLLKHKARIPVPQGITLFGIMDETGFLQENEVFVTYDTMKGRHEPPPEHSASLLVTRSPALHPGDIQLATNVIPRDGHPLRQLDNCIVFSKRGARDLPSQLSGGDLDGDVFNVIWDPKLVHTVRTFVPASYARVDPLELDREIQTSDMADFFIDFMKTDHLGVVATRHMILADLREAGTLDPDCVRLAELHSSAVDFSKTGRAVQLDQLPKAKWRPDFLAPVPQVFVHNKSDIELDSYILPDDNDEDDEDGPRHRYYFSDRVLGKLYRAVDEERIWNEDIRQVLPRGGASFWDQLITRFQERIKSLGYQIDWHHRSEEAHRLRHAYDHAVEELMTENAENPSQPLTELEVFVGFFLNKTGGALTRRQRDRSVRLKDEFDRVTTWITRQLRKPTPLVDTTSELDALELCLACVYVGCMKETVEVVRWNHSRRLAPDVESFRVVAACALLRELNSLDPSIGRRYNGGGGGFVGVR
ncbi:RNA-dependent RNA polymerase 1 [Naviculisporaceae sp. PSN 640]